MNKFSLSFIDPKIESQYLEQNWNSTTRSSFSILSFGVILAFAVRVAMAHINHDFQLYFMKIAMLTYAVIQFGIVKWRPKLGRLGFLVLNAIIVMYDYFESIDYNVDNEISSIRGANLMAISILFMQTGEFLDAVISLTAIIFYQLLYFFIGGATLNMSALITTFIVRLYLFYYLYQFHKAKRSQFLLGVIETCWDNIFVSLIHKPFILIKFNYQNLAFSIENSNNLPFTIQDNGSRKFPDAYYFLHHASIGKQGIQNYLYDQIKIFQSNHQNIYDVSVYAKFQNKQIMLKYSIFSAKDPLILIKIEPYKQIQRIYMDTLFTKYTEQMVKMLDYISLAFHYSPIQILRRKLIFVQCLEQILQNQISLQSIDINSIASQIRQLFPDYLVIFTIEDQIQKIETFPNILLSFLILVINCSRNKKLIVNINQDDFCSFEIQSSFNIQKLNSYYKKLEDYINLILTNVHFREKCILLSYLAICFNLQQDPILPFKSDVKD